MITTLILLINILAFAYMTWVINNLIRERRKLTPIKRIVRMRWSTEERNRVLQLHKQNVMQIEIAKICNIPVSTVQWIISKGK